MCRKFELRAKFNNLPKALKQDYPPRLSSKYEIRTQINPLDPVLVIKNEGQMKTTFMSWGFISPWAKNPFDKSLQRPYNARSETVWGKKLFQDSWRNKRCLIPATGFIEKGYRIRKKDYATFWLGGIWSRWTSPDGTELESCCILTTDPNNLIKPLHHRMPVVIPEGIEEQWTENIKDNDDLKRLLPIMRAWSPEDWLIEELNKSPTFQMSLF